MPEKLAQTRQFIVLSGQPEWCFLSAKKLVTNINESQILYFTRAENSQLKGQSSHTINQVLGREHQAVIFDAFSGFNPDAFAAIAGTIVAGGVLILLCPSLDDWAGFDDPYSQRMRSWPYTHQDATGNFITYFTRQLELANDAFIRILTEKDSISALPPISHHQYPHSFVTHEQQHVISAIEKLSVTELPQPLVIEADRGRGKSAAMGKAAGLLMAQPINIIVTAPSLKTTDIIFNHAQITIGETSQQAGKLTKNNASLCFIAPDACIKELPKADILFVDEAASLPSPILKALLAHYPRIVFASTIHGYEGTGQGFFLRFSQHLNKHTPNWVKLSLHSPIRYGENDPLESFIFNSLLLRTIDLSSEKIAEWKDYSIEKIEQKTLLENHDLLHQVFGLLVLAHYQTRPSDLYHLLDGVNVSIYIARVDKEIIATALTVKEGGFPKDLAHDIHYGKRRPQGNLVPQSLTVHAGMASAPLLTTQRIMRIVVHPSLQHNGIGSELLEAIEQDSSHVDYLSSSFAATSSMVLFWTKQHYLPIHMGFHRDASSGSHSLIVIKPLSSRGKSLTTQAQHRFSEQFPALLEGSLSELEVDIIQSLKISSITIDHTLSKNDWDDLTSFAYGHRGYECCSYAIGKLIRLKPVTRIITSKLDKHEQALLHYQVTRRASTEKITSQLKYSGRKQVLKSLRLIIIKIIESTNNLE